MHALLCIADDNNGAPFKVFDILMIAIVCTSRPNLKELHILIEFDDFIQKVHAYTFIPKHKQIGASILRVKFLSLTFNCNAFTVITFVSEHRFCSVFYGSTNCSFFLILLIPMTVN